MALTKCQFGEQAYSDGGLRSMSLRKKDGIVRCSYI